MELQLRRQKALSGALLRLRMCVPWKECLRAQLSTAERIRELPSARQLWSPFSSSWLPSHEVADTGSIGGQAARSLDADSDQVTRGPQLVSFWSRGVGPGLREGFHSAPLPGQVSPGHK